LKRLPASTLLLLVACQVSPISIVECRVSSDCDAGMVCDETNHCVDEPDLGTGGTGGMAGAPASNDPYVATLLSWIDLGLVTSNSNPFGIHGQWSWIDDCESVKGQIDAGLLVCPVDSPNPGCCASRDPTLFSPLPDQGSGMSIVGTREGAPGKVCFKGTTAHILTNVSGMVAYDWQWGFNGGLPLADWEAFDASREFVGGRIIGFRMTVDGPATDVPLSITFGTTTNIDYGASVSVPAGPVTLLFADAKAADWVVDPPPLDVSLIYEIIFHIGGNTEAATPFDFCVSDLQVLQARAPQ
jgi:hypothetical protein